MLEPTGKDASEEALNSDTPLDVILLPGAAFDRQGRRVGRGKGFYDKYITACERHAEMRNKPRPRLIGLSFYEQLLNTAPADLHDQPVDFLALPSGLIRCSASGESAKTGEVSRAAGS